MNVILDTCAIIWCDRFIVAAARLRSMPVITADRKILDYPHVQSQF
jgi:PIN domain nuclease of toxin-antitoxin system